MAHQEQHDGGGTDSRLGTAFSTFTMLGDTTGVSSGAPSWRPSRRLGLSRPCSCSTRFNSLQAAGGIGTTCIRLVFRTDTNDLTVSSTVDPMQRFRTYLLPGFLPSLRTKGGPIGFQGGRIDSCCSIFELF